MKIFLNILSLLAITVCAHAQTTVMGTTVRDELPRLLISDNISLHFISPEPIQMADISSDRLVGDLPVENILRVRYLADTSEIATHGYGRRTETVITIVGQSFMAQYNLVYVPDDIGRIGVTSVEVLPEYMRPLNFPEISLSNHEIKEFAIQVMKRKRTYHNVASRSSGMTAWLNNIYCFGDYIFLDVSFANGTRIKYDVDQFRFTIQDKRIVKATNVQDVEVSPIFTLYQNPYFRRSYRNIFVFKKFTYPGDKVLTVQLSEKQISGRTIELKIDYMDLLNADTL